VWMFEKEPLNGRCPIWKFLKRHSTIYNKLYSYNVIMPAKVDKSFIKDLKSNQIFVFGSNRGGTHGEGTASWGLDKGLIKMGQDYDGISSSGKAYGVITMDGYDVLKNGIKRLTEYVKQHTDKEFLITPLGTGIGKLDPRKVWEIIEKYGLDELPNVTFRGPWKYIGK